MSEEDKTEINNLKYILEIHKINNKILLKMENIIEKQEKQIKKKDKVIEEIAKAFKQDDIRSVEVIKEYFERKVENEI